MFCAELKIKRCIGQIAQHSAGGGIAARPAPVEKSVSHHVTPHEHSIEDVIDAAQTWCLALSGINCYLHSRPVARLLIARLSSSLTPGDFTLCSPAPRPGEGRPSAVLIIPSSLIV